MAFARWGIVAAGAGGGEGESSKTPGAWQTGHRLQQRPGLNS